MKMAIFIAVFSLFFARWRYLAAAGFSALLVGWALVIVDGRRGKRNAA